MTPESLLLALLFLAAATLYASVGHAGASAYLAAMALVGLAPEAMRPTALVLNLFVASIVVPLLKMLALLVILVAVQRGVREHCHDLARLYRLLEIVGRWSMLDIFVVAILVALVQLQLVATVTPGQGAAAFGAVVVLTMLATMSFDPRLIWESARGEDRYVGRA